MKELTEDEYAKIGRELGYEESRAAREGRAAYAASFPYAVAVARLTVLEQRCERGTPWDMACLACARAVEALTAKPDPALEAVKALTINWKAGMKLTDESAREVVAAVDKARGEAQLDALPRATVRAK